MPVCQRCWRNLKTAGPALLTAKEMPPYLDDLHACFLFDALFQKIIHTLKYQNFRSVGFQLGQAMAAALPARYIQNQETLYVPVPLHPIKQRERGFNQSQIILNGLTDKLAVETAPLLIQRVKNTSSQTQLTKAEREINMQNAFAVNPKYIHNYQRIILIDDVFTTGATMNAAAKALKQQGIKSVYALTAAAPS